VRLKLALAVGLQGRLAGAESIVRSDRPPRAAQANVADLKPLLAAKENARAEAGKPRAGAARQPD
jgi:Flp pilus assembly protein TadD